MAAIQHLGIAATYEARDVDASGMQAQAILARSGDLAGANITMPHKAFAAALCDDLAASARAVGGVNTWVIRDGRITGHSTDGEGVRYAWRVGGLPGAGDVVILGAGGAASAAAAELAATHTVRISARRADAAQAIADRVGVGACAWGTVVEGATVVNATSIGMHGETLDPTLTAGASAYFEMVYAAGATPAEQDMRTRGLAVAAGVDMLLGQAAASFRLWFGVEAPIAVMRAALKGSSA